MAHIIDTRSDFKIISLIEKNPSIGVNWPSEETTQDVRLNAPFQRWRSEKVGDKVYLLNIGTYPSTKIINNKVVTSGSEGEVVKWVITYHGTQSAYTIAPADDPKRGWTVVPGSSEVEIQPIKRVRSFPPQYPANQLFVFEAFFD